MTLRLVCYVSLACISSLPNLCMKDRVLPLPHNRRIPHISSVLPSIFIFMRPREFPQPMSTSPHAQHFLQTLVKCSQIQRSFSPQGSCTSGQTDRSVDCLISCLAMTLSRRRITDAHQFLCLPPAGTSRPWWFLEHGTLRPNPLAALNVA